MSRKRRVASLLRPGVRAVRWRAIREATTVFGDALAGMRPRMALTLLVTLGATIARLLVPWPLQVVLDRVLSPSGRLMTRPEQAMWLTGAGVAACLLPLLVAVFRYRAQVMSAEIGKTAVLRIRRRLFDHVNRLSLNFHTQSRMGDLLIRLTGDVNLIRDILFTSWLNLVDRGLYFLGLSVALLVVDWRLGLIALAPLPLLSGAVRESSAELKSVVRSQRKREGNTAALASESLTQIRVLKAFVAEDAMSERFARDAGRSERAGVKAARLAAQLELSSQQMASTGASLVLFFGALLVLSDQMTIGVLLVAVTYTKALYKPLRRISGETGRLAKASAVTERVLEVLRVEPEDPSIGVPISSRLEGHIRADGLGYRYPDGSPTFHHVAFDIPPGALVAVVGPNGVGKSTLLSLLLRFDAPSEGDLTVDGRPIRHYRLSDYRSRIAYVPQSVLLFSGSIRENLLLGNPFATDDDLNRAVETAQLADVLRRLPDGLDTHVGERGETLSGGEARRVMLARAAVRDADILLMDEPFEGIDAPSRPLVAEAIRRIAEGRTTLVVSHVGVDDLIPDLELPLTFDARSGAR